MTCRGGGKRRAVTTCILLYHSIKLVLTETNIHTVEIIMQLHAPLFLTEICEKTLFAPGSMYKILIRRDMVNGMQPLDSRSSPTMLASDLRSLIHWFIPCGIMDTFREQGLAVMTSNSNCIGIRICTIRRQELKRHISTREILHLSLLYLHPVSTVFWKSIPWSKIADFHNMDSYQNVDCPSILQDMKKPCVFLWELICHWSFMKRRKRTEQTSVLISRRGSGIYSLRTIRVINSPDREFWRSIIIWHSQYVIEAFGIRLGGLRSIRWYCVSQQKYSLGNFDGGHDMEYLWTEFKEWSL